MIGWVVLFACVVFVYILDWLLRLPIIGTILTIIFFLGLIFCIFCVFPGMINGTLETSWN